MKVTIVEAKDRLPELIRAAQAGEEVVICDHGETGVRLAPVGSQDVSLQRGSAAAILALLSEPRPEGWRQKTDEEIDAVIRETREAWD